jgi:PAS domain S-box-containing protein
VPNDRESGLVSLLQEASRASNEADQIVDAARRVLAAVCRATEWPVGHLCLPDEHDHRIFVSTDVWHLAGPATFDRLREACEGLRFPLGSGLVGQAAETAAPVWSRDVAAEPGFLRGRDPQIARGLGGAVAFPVVSQGVAAAVLEFYADEAIEPDPRLLEVMADIGTQLGRVADRVAAQRALRNSNQRLERIMDTSVEAFVSMDEGGMITAWNAAAEQTFGLSREQALGQRLADTIVPPRFRDAHHLGVGRFLTTGEKHVLDRRIEITAWHPAGYEFPVELAAWAVPDDTGGWTFNAFLHDITERKAGEAVLRDAYEHERSAVALLRELDVVKREFVANVSHELRTPLANVIGHLEVLTTGEAGPLNGSQTRMLDVVNRNADRLRALIEDLLTISKVEAGAFDLTFEWADIASLLKQVYTAVEPRARRRNHQLNLSVDEDLGQLVVDAEQLSRALTNLLVNAINFTPERGRVTLSARLNGNAVEIIVADNGVGIDSDELPRLFTRFFRGTFAVREAIQGAGLGLAITKTIIEGHGGTIVVESEPGDGSAFIVRLPCERPPWMVLP